MIDAFGKTVHWKRNWFMMPRGTVGGKYVDEITRFLKVCIRDSPLKAIVLKSKNHRKKKILAIYYMKEKQFGKK